MLHTYFNTCLCLNQETRPDRWQQFSVEAKRIGLVAERFPSVPHENAFISFCNSQIAMIRHCYKKGGSALLLEDDCVFKPMGHWDELYSQRWDMMYLGCNPTEVPAKINQHVYRINGAWTSHAIAYTNEVMGFILDHYKGWEQDGMYDDWLSRKVVPKFIALCPKPFIAIQRDGRSDMWNNHVSYGWNEMEGRLR